MEVLLIGGNRGLGYEILKELTKNNIKVNCLIRKKGLINFDNSNIKIFYGDATNLNDLKKALGKSKIIISSINVQRKNIFPWSKLTNSKKTISDFTKNVLEVSENNINRIITVSAWGVGDSIAEIPKIFKFLIKYSNLKYPYRDHYLHEKIIESSNANWTILRPTALTNEKGYHEVKAYDGKEGRPKLTIGRKSLAKFIVKIINDKSYFKKKLIVSRI
jgi:putative NADH-flavin reductase